MKEERLSKAVLKWLPAERRKQGTPETTWAENISIGRARDDRNLQQNGTGQNKVQKGSGDGTEPTDDKNLLNDDRCSEVNVISRPISGIDM
jgi:hypothetical protein